MYMEVNLEPAEQVGQNKSYHGTLDDVDVMVFNRWLAAPIRKADSEKDDTFTTDFKNLYSFNNAQSETKGAAQALAKSASESTWSVDQENRTIYLDNGYKIVIEGKDQAWQIIDAEGNVSRIWGDPHVHEDDGGKWDFKADMTFVLEDGTKITVQTKDIGNGTSVSNNLIITNGDNCVQVTGLAANQPVITEVTNNGQEMDTDTYDGYIANEMGGTDDWSRNDEEIRSNLPFVDHSTFLYGMNYYNDSFTAELIDLKSNYTEEEINQHFDDLETELKDRLAAAKEMLENADRYHDRKFYQDYVTALEGDLNALNNNRNTGTLQERAQFFNNLHTEASIEMKHNIVLTHESEPAWSEQDLRDLETELEKMPLNFSLFNPKLSRIGIQDLPEGVSGYNRDTRGIDIETGDIDWALIHEIGHYYDENDENSNIQEFMDISGWRDVTSSFNSISDDYVNGAYRPYDGSAVLNRDGQVYNDGDAIDLDGDGQNDGIVQVQKGKVMIYDQSATFARQYGTVNPVEDFATTFETFFKNPTQLQQNAPEKYDFMVAYTGVDPANTNSNTLSVNNEPVKLLGQENLFDLVD